VSKSEQEASEPLAVRLQVHTLDFLEAADFWPLSWLAWVLTPENDLAES